MAKFGEYLVQRGMITSEQLEKALLIQREENEQGYHRMIGYIILNEYGLGSKTELYSLLKEWKDEETTS